MKTKIVLLFLLGWVGMVFGQNLINESRILLNPTDLFQYSASSASKKSTSTVPIIGNSKL
ncbi:hypothetical protein BOQ62_06450 [Chryseobacterium sp. CH21]|nr:hypothetical protein BOQ62_06450 [Chryseobacterium sp. CH21]